MIERTEGVIRLTPRLAFSGLSSHGEATIASVGEGIDTAHERPISRRITIVAGRDLAAANEAVLMLGEGLARRLGVKPDL